ncbi:MAG: PIN domain-containing protein [Actinophytocola sp.]|nr:PIN domain-containing protein [Actinophytocola sp.]
MQMPDVNALVYAHRGELPQHERYRDWLSGLLNGLESYGVSDLVTLGFQRIVTNPRIFREPTPVADVLRFVDVFRHRPQAIPVVPGQRHWSIYQDLCHQHDATGADVTDAYLAALAIEHGHDLVTEDKGIRRRFPGLRTMRP